MWRGSPSVKCKLTNDWMRRMSENMTPVSTVGQRHMHVSLHTNRDSLIRVQMSHECGYISRRYEERVEKRQKCRVLFLLRPEKWDALNFFTFLLLFFSFSHTHTHIHTYSCTFIFSSAFLCLYVQSTYTYATYTNHRLTSTNTWARKLVISHAVLSLVSRVNVQSSVPLRLTV